MIFITGDIHGVPTKLLKKNFPEQLSMKKNIENNYVIILGDFGIIWDYRGEDKEEKYWLDYLEERPFATLFLDGNHDCFPRINQFPVVDFYKGKAHQIRNNVYHLIRGEIYEIESKKFFVFGGGQTHDIEDGLLDMNDPNLKRKKQLLKKQHKTHFRIIGKEWWPEELPNEDEMLNGLNNLEKYNYEIDYILSHTPSTSNFYEISNCNHFDKNILTDYLDDIKTKTKYKKHFMGHMHIDEILNEKDIVVYNVMHKLN